MKTKIITLITMLILMSSVLFASGTSDSSATTSSSAGAVVYPGKLEIWASPAEFETATGMKLPAFSESPDLAKLVAEGELPPLAERLPDEPVVIDPLNEIGTYGGDIRTSGLSPTRGGEDAMFGRLQNFLTLTPDRTKLIPNFVRDWTISDDYKSTTLHLRKGLKWSDGASVTADDFLFWYEDFLMNKDLTPRPGVAWRPGGEVMKVTKVDDFTVRYSFAVPYPTVANKFSFSPYSRGTGNFPILPQHYLKQFHISYNAKAPELAAEAGFDNWFQMFQDNHVGGDEMGRRDTDMPELKPWRLASLDDYGNRYYDRNAFYWKVDTQGQQLPYTDRQVVINAGNMDVVTLKAIAGEFDVVTFSITLDNYPLYKEGEAAGDYTTLLWDLPRNEVAYGFNQTYGDAVLADIFKDLRFRQAMSVAINREEINKVVAFGRAIPRQATGPLPPEGYFTEDWMDKHFAEYDPDKAAALLDEMGLKWDSDGKYRLRPDGSTLELLFEYFRTEGPKEKIYQMTADYWEAVGVKVVLKEIASNLFWTRNTANEVQVYNFHFDNRGPNGMIWREAPHYKDGFGRLYLDWYNTKGETGLEPPADIKKVYELVDALMLVPLGSEDSIKIGKELLTTHVNQLLRIGTIDMIPQPVIVKNGLMTNFTEKDVWAPEGLWHNNTIPEQWFWKE